MLFRKFFGIVGKKIAIKLFRKSAAKEYKESNELLRKGTQRLRRDTQRNMKKGKSCYAKVRRGWLSNY